MQSQIDNNSELDVLEYRSNSKLWKDNCIFFVQVIVLDTDVFFLTDIAELWQLFDEFQNNQVTLPCVCLLLSVSNGSQIVYTPYRT